MRGIGLVNLLPKLITAYHIQSMHCILILRPVYQDLISFRFLPTLLFELILSKNLLIQIYYKLMIWLEDVWTVSVLEAVAC